MTKTISILAFSILLLASCSQNRVRRGDLHYKEMSFKKAARDYEKALQYKDLPQTHAKAALAYERMNDNKNAETHYEQALRSPDAKPETKYHYALTLFANGKEEGLLWMNKYSSENPDDEMAKEWINKKTKTGEYTGYDHSKMKVELVAIEGYTAAFAAAPGNDGLFFVGEKELTATEKVNPWNGASFLDVYELKRENDSTWSKPKTIKGNLNSELHEGPLTVTPNGQTMYVTRSTLGKNRHQKLDKSEIDQLKILRFNLVEGGKWEKAEDMPFNKPNSSSMHPAICADEKTLFFVSDRIGGYGGTDLYVVRNDGGKWSEPENLGSDVNTPGNELFPYAYNKDTLFFSSNGHGGMGGLDIFVSTFNGQIWSHPLNMKEPMNTNSDDFSYFAMADGKSGYISSTRGGKDEIYSWKRLAPELLVVGQVIDIDKDPVMGAMVILYKDKIAVDSVTSDAKGHFEMPLVRDHNYTLRGHVENQKTDVVSLNTNGVASSRTFEVELKLEGPEFLVKGFVVDAKTKEKLSNVTVELHDNEGFKLDGMLSDVNGAFTFKLKRNESYKVYGARKNYFTRKVAVSTLGLKKSKTFEVQLELEVTSPETAIVLHNIYYDYEKWNIRKDAVGELDDLLSFMKDNPEAKIMLSAHTDSRGPDKYNLELSEKRAKSASDYLISKKIDKSRIQYKGYGETKLTNECKNEVKCSEEKQQANRRTEFEVIK